MTSLSITGRDLTGIRAHAESTYPEEGCGLLIGRSLPGDVRHVLRVEATENRAAEERRRRYVIPPDVLREADARLESRGESVIGIFHSHPDHPAVPSAFDRQHAVPWFAYLLVSVECGTTRDVGAFELEPERWTFQPVPVTVRPDVRPSTDRTGG